MTSEAAVLGIPSLRCNSFAGRISYLEEEEHKYQLTFGFKPEHYSDMLIKLKELLAMSDLKPEFRKRRQKMLKDKIDVTAFWTWIIDQYPESIKIMKENPDYQYNFR
jgi:predicted glycosyltransferase